MQEDDSYTQVSASDRAFSCDKSARTDSGYPEGQEGNNDKININSHSSETYQTLLLDEESHSLASAKRGFLPSSNTFDCIYSEVLPFYHRNPIAK